MSQAADLLVPLLAAAVFLYGRYRKVPLFSCFVRGAEEGLRQLVRILPSLCVLMLAVSMLRASGVLEFLAGWAAPFCSRFGLPPEVLPLALLRPVSGSGALVVLQDLLTQCGPDSPAGRTASVLMGSTETTFYTVAVYYGAVKVQKTGHTLCCALLADLAGLCFSVLFTQMLFG